MTPALARFEAARREMLAAWSAWLETCPPRDPQMQQEYAATRDAMRQIWELAGIPGTGEK
jgi:hypothetical protein